MICIFKAIHYYYLMYLRTFEVFILRHMNFILQNFSASGIAWQVTLKKTKLKLDLFTVIDMLLMV